MNSKPRYRKQNRFTVVYDFLSDTGERKGPVERDYDCRTAKEAETAWSNDFGDDPKFRVVEVRGPSIVDVADWEIRYGDGQRKVLRNWTKSDAEEYARNSARITHAQFDLTAGLGSVDIHYCKARLAC